MLWTQTLIPTQKEKPADAQIISHQLLIRAGFIRQVTAGAYDFLPLGWRSLHKAIEIVRQEMDAIGASEVLLPALQPMELWQRSGRDVAYGENLMKFKDRHGRTNVLGPTHEEVITEMVMASVNSYRQLPLSLYQIQTKFRDEYRPRFGLLRVREFLMKDGYSFHASLDSLNETYDKFYHAYEKIFTRCGIPYVTVEADSGPIGGSASHEFMAACTAGEDTIVNSDKGNYSANVEKAEIGKREISKAFASFASNATLVPIHPAQPIREIETPGADSIEALCKGWPKFGGSKLKPENVLKTVVFAGHDLTPPSSWEKLRDKFPGGHPVWIVIAVVRGSDEVNVAKLQKAMAGVLGRSVNVEVMAPAQAEELGISIGYVAPDWPSTMQDSTRRGMAHIFIDPDAAQSKFWVVGANRAGWHRMHFDWERDLLEPSNHQLRALEGSVHVADIRNAVDGDPSPKNDGGKLVASKGIEMGHVFKLGTRYSDALGALYLDEKGEKHPMIMGCYGIGIGRILIAAVEAMHDDKGIIWPVAIAPYKVVVTPIKYEGEVKTAVDKIYQDLMQAGFDVLLDDRDQRPGVKFNDADLIGIPIRINVGDRGLKEGKVELKQRKAEAAEMVDLADVVAAVRTAIAG